MKILLQKVVQLIVKQEGTGLQRRDIADQEDNYVCTRSCVEYYQMLLTLSFGGPQLYNCHSPITLLLFVFVLCDSMFFT